MSSLSTLEKKTRQLSPDLIVKVEEYIDSLQSKSNANTDIKPKFLKQDWGCCLKDLKEQYSSIELQKLIR